MSKRKLISLILVLMLTLTLVFGLISCNRKVNEEPENPTTDPSIEVDDKDTWLSCEHTYTDNCDDDCDVCGEKRTPNHAYDDDKDKFCNVCGEERKIICISGHDYDNACDTDCNSCGNVREVGEHIYDGDRDATCNECGATREVDCEVHTYDNECDAECNVCGATREVEAHNFVTVPTKPATCTEDGLSAYVACSYCGYKFEEPEIIPAAHTYMNACDADCEICGFERIPAGHITEIVGAIDPTCTNVGYTESERCTVCGKVVRPPQPIDPLGHTWDETQYVSDGTGHWYECSVCGAKNEESFGNHTYNSDLICTECMHGCEHLATRWEEYKAPTCSEEGRRIEICEACGKVVGGEDIEKAPHTPDPEVPDEKVSCDNPQTCIVCNATLKSVEHTPSAAPTCTVDQICTVCNKVLAEAIGHLMDGPEASCTRNQVCNRYTCDEIVAPALGHLYSSDCDTVCDRGCGDAREGTVAAHTIVKLDDVAATCIEVGYKGGEKCSACGQVTKEPTLVPATGHLYDGTCDADCNVCGADRPGNEVHIYDNDCDKNCNQCGYVRDNGVTIHVYDRFGCDADCNVCGALRDPHRYSSPCDSVCDKCEKTTRIAELDHTYNLCTDLECAFCGYTRPSVMAQHNRKYPCSERCSNSGCKFIFTDAQPHNVTVAYGETAHWNTCSDCGTNSGWAVHTFANTCTSDKCEYCEYTREDVQGHIFETSCSQYCSVCGADNLEITHDFSITAYDDNIHYKKCKNCPARDASSSEPHDYTSGSVCSCGRSESVAGGCEHYYIADCSDKCATCGDARQPIAEHNYQFDTENNEFNHRKVCAACGDTINDQPHAYKLTSVDENTHIYACAVCAKTNGEAVKHVYENGACACGNVTTCNHTGGTATCQTRAICDTCGFEYGELGEHTFTELDAELPAGCESEGLTASYKCVCGYIKEAEVVAPLGHNAVNVVGYPATCTTPGMNPGKECSRCNISLEGCEEIAQKQHVYATTSVVNATCTKPGEVVRICIYCPDVQHDYPSELGHIDGTPTIKPATCFEDGSKTTKCTRCGEITLEEPIEQLTHNYVYVETIAPTCNSEGYDLHRCTHCSGTSKQNGTGFLSHNFEDKVVIVPATCENSGQKKQVCSLCGASQVVDIPSNGSHTYSTTLSNNENAHWKQCSVCNTTIELELHTFVDGVCSNENCGYACVSHTGGTATCQDRARCALCNAEYGDVDTSKHIPGAPATCTTAQTCQLCMTELAPATHTAKVVDNAVAPTCAKPGLTEGWHCSACGESKAQELDERLPEHTFGDDGKCTGCGTVRQGAGTCEHSFTDCLDTECNLGCGYTREAPGHVEIVVAGYEATCDTIGMTSGMKCAVCDAVTVEQTEIPAAHPGQKLHVESVATCTQSGISYYVCTLCNQKIGTDIEVTYEGHKLVTIDVASTCTTYGYTIEICKVCGSSEGQIPKTELAEHIPGEYVVVTAATCETKGMLSQRCQVCQMSIRDIETDLAPHTEKITVTKPTCTDNGLIAYSCSVCGAETKTSSPIPATGHVQGDNWVVEGSVTCLTSATKYQACLVCNFKIEGTEVTIDALGHNYIGKVEVIASCTQEGQLLYTCSGCGDFYTVTVPALDHTPGDWVETTPPTATESGIEEQICSVCGQATGVTRPVNPNPVSRIISRAKLAAPRAACEHEFGGYDIETKATCTTEGTKYEICAHCGDRMSDAIAIETTEHSYHTETTAPTCTTEGFTTQICNLCNDVKTTSIEPTGHKAGGWKVISAPNCTETGIKHEICMNCGNTISESEIPQVGHKYIAKIVAPTCTTEGYTEYTCYVCNEDSYRENITPKTEHLFGGWVVDTPATCTESGSKHEVCAYCGEDTGVTEEIYSEGHTPVTIKVLATCMSDGYTRIICAKCGDEQAKTDIVSATGHTPSEWITEKAATCTEGGTHYKVCTTCGTRTSTEEVAPLNHSFAEPVVIPPLCGSGLNGYSQHDCINCSYSYTDTEVEYTHNFGANGMCQNANCYEWLNTNVECDHTYDADCDANCNICGAVREAAPHTEKINPAVPATCMDTGLTEGIECTACGRTLKVQTVTAKIAHTYSNNCDSKCDIEGCTGTRTPQPHVYTNSCDTTCNECGAVRAITHTYSNNCDAECNVCFETRTVGDHVYTHDCDATCNECGATRSITHKYDNCYDTTCNTSGCGQTRPVTHNYGGDKTCDDCGYVLTCEHKWDDCLDTTCNLCGETRVGGHSGGSATCSKKAVCEVCGKSYGDYLPHTPNIANPTCTDNQICTVCHRMITAALGHDYKEVVTDPTCTEQGYTTTTCSRCDLNLVGSYVSANGHTLKTLAYVAPTCSKEGLTEGKQCSVCGITTVSQTPISKVAHTYDNDDDLICNVCNAERDPGCTHTWDNACDTDCNLGCGYIRATTHAYDGSFSYENGGSTHWEQCTICGHKNNVASHKYDNSCDTDCNTCGATRTTNHRFSTAYTKDASGHWNVCSVCKAINKVETHNYDNVCDATCSVCNYRRTIEHNFASGTYASDGTYHWYKCDTAGCTGISTKTAHAWENSCDPKCDTCGYTRSVSHTWSGTWTKGESGHWKVCTKCNVSDTIQSHTYAYDCTTACSVCGFARVASHKYAHACDTTCDYGCGYTRTVSHSYALMWSGDGTNHWKECTNTQCNAINEKAAHTYSNSCDNTCNICGSTQGRENVGHTWGSTWTKTSNGHYNSCTKCNAANTVIAHVYSHNCDTDCNTCGYTRTITHEWAQTYTQTSTTHYKKCTTDGCSATQLSGAHVWTNNCDTECNTCGYQRTTTHSMSNWITDTGSHWKQCTSCGLQTSEGTHAFANDCDGLCETCGYTRTTKHVYDNDCDTTCNVCQQTRTDITHTYVLTYQSNANQHWQECKFCDATRNVSAHNYVNDVCSICSYDNSSKHNFSSTYTYDGTYHWYKCTDSGCSETTGKAAHRYSSNCSDTCRDCGYKRTSGMTHTYVSYTTDANEHWQICAVCKGAETTKVAHTYDGLCDSTCNGGCGYTRVAPHDYDHGCDDTCNGCGKVRQVTHEYIDEYYSDGASHWQQCKNCGQGIKAQGSHTYKNNCSIYCTTCGYARQNVTHTYSSMWSKDSSNHWHACSICGEKTDITPHGYDNACDNTCDCGQTRTVGDHNWSSTYKTDGNYHWYQCTYCNKVKDKGVHTYDTACDADCNTCKYVREGASHNYASGTAYSSDATHHWYACKNNCGAKQGYVEHDYDNGCDTSCNTCSKTRTTTHKTPSSYNGQSSTHHWKICTECGTELSKTIHVWSAACDSICDTCGYERTASHSWSATYTSDDNQHWKKCISCSTPNEATRENHQWTNDCDTKCDTCGKTRTTTHKFDHNCDTTCNVQGCGYTRGITHNYSSTWSKSESQHWHECTVCTARRDTASHIWDSAQDTSCNACGQTREAGACSHVYDNACGDLYCNLCSAQRTDLAPHTYDSDCSTRCSVCNGGVRAANHLWAYSCSTECGRCGSTRSASHSYSNWSSNSTHHWKACTYGCGSRQSADAVHVYSATCDNTCDVCGNNEKVTSHSWSSEYEKDATQHYYVCSGCGNKGSAAKHVYASECSPLCTTCGYSRTVTHQYASTYTYNANNHYYKCQYCSAQTSISAHQFVYTSLNANQHQKTCKVCKYSASTDAHSYGDDKICDLCGYEKVIVETYATSIDYINTNGPFVSYGSNSVDGIEVLKGYGSDWNGRLYISGWCVAGSTITGYHYSLDGGKTWTQIQNPAVKDAGDAHMNAASGLAGVSQDAPRSNCVFENLTIDFKALGLMGKHYDSVTFAASTSNGSYIQIVKFEDFTVWNPTANGRPAAIFEVGSTVKSYSVDSLKLNGGFWSVHPTMPQGTASNGHGINHTYMTIKSGEYISLAGWLGFTNHQINTFGYFYADKPANVTLSTAFVGSAEQGVVNAGGAYAKRFVIDVDTSTLADGNYRIYFVAQRSDGTIVIIQYVDIHVSGKDDDYVQGTTDPADSAITPAIKDTTSNFSTAPSKSGNTYTFGSNLSFTTSASYNSSNYRFTATSSGATLTINTKYSELFNRVKFRYVSSNALRAVMTYVDAGGNILTDTLYLEHGQGTFTFLVNGYLDEAAIKQINSITFYPLGTSSTSFMLAGIDTEMYEYYTDDMTYIQNARFKVGTRLAWGGALCYLEDKNDGVADLRNLINIYDVGRLVQQSYYGTKVTGNYNGTPWKYNPVQGGDWRNNESRIIDVVVEDYGIYIKSQPMEWGAGSDGNTATISPSYMENWYTLYSDRLYIENRFYDYSGYGSSNTAVNQEIPAFYFVGYLNSFAYDAGSGSWSSTNIQYKTNLPFWAGGSGSDNVYDSNYAQTTRFPVSGQETWGAWYNAQANFGVGFYVPGIARFISGRNQYNIWGDTTSPFSPGCSYTATGIDYKLPSFQEVKYSYLMTTGSVTNIRSTFSKYYSVCYNSLK